jgi:hypothetical protein
MLSNSLVFATVKGIDSSFKPIYETTRSSACMKPNLARVVHGVSRLWSSILSHEQYVVSL